MSELKIKKRAHTHTEMGILPQAIYSKIKSNSNQTIS